MKACWLALFFVLALIRESISPPSQDDASSSETQPFKVSKEVSEKRGIDKTKVDQKEAAPTEGSSEKPDARSRKENDEKQNQKGNEKLVSDVAPKKLVQDSLSNEALSTKENPGSKPEEKIQHEENAEKANKKKSLKEKSNTDETPKAPAQPSSSSELEPESKFEDADKEQEKKSLKQESNQDGTPKVPTLSPGSSEHESKPERENDGNGDEEKNKTSQEQKSIQDEIPKDRPQRSPTPSSSETEPKSMVENDKNCSISKSVHEETEGQDDENNNDGDTRPNPVPFPIKQSKPEQRKRKNESDEEEGAVEGESSDEEEGAVEGENSDEEESDDEDERQNSQKPQKLFQTGSNLNYRNKQQFTKMQISKSQRKLDMSEFSSDEIDFSVDDSLDSDDEFDEKGDFSIPLYSLKYLPSVLSRNSKANNLSGVLLKNFDTRKPSSSGELLRNFSPTPWLNNWYNNGKKIQKNGEKLINFNIGASPKRTTTRQLV